MEYPADAVMAKVLTSIPTHWGYFLDHSAVTHSREIGHPCQTVRTP